MIKDLHFDLDQYQPVPIVYQMRASLLQRIARGEDILPDIQGREETKRDVARALLSGYNIYLVSEEGTGKTRLAKSLTKLLSSIPRIKGCPYNDDPKWPPHLLCPRCKGSKDPAAEFGVELVPGAERFSRIQGNDYTDEGKLLGLKDIQAIARGKSPTDRESFAATGVFRANRGILFIDELPAVRTKVQVLLHPISEEKKAILEEYNWEHPLDIILVATGNPQGFSHVNEVPRPLLDRLELIYMPLPAKDVELEIVLREKFKANEISFFSEEGGEALLPQVELEDVERVVVLPWWIMHLVNEATACSRECGVLDRQPSIRGGYRALDHTYASAELENRKIAYLKDAYDGLKLAFRGRIELKPDLIDFDNPAESFDRVAELTEDLLAVALGNSVNLFLGECNTAELASDLRSLASQGIQNITCQLQKYRELRRTVERMKAMARGRIDSSLLTPREKDLFYKPDDAGEEVTEQYNCSAVEVIFNAALHGRLINENEVEKTLFLPKLAAWARERGDAGDSREDNRRSKGRPLSHLYKVAEG